MPGRAMRFLFLVWSLAGAALARTGDVEPFPTKSAEYKTDGIELRVEGRTRIPRNADVISLRQGRITGVSDAVIEVAGYLELKCVTGGNMVLSNVWIELLPECKEIYLSGVVFEGNGGIRPSEEGACRARVYMERTTFKPGTGFELASTSGKLTLSGVTSRVPFVVRGEAKDEKGANQTELQVLSMKAYGGVVVENVRKTLVTMSMIGGEESSFTDCESLELLTNHTRSERLKLSQTEPGKFGRTKIKNTDFLSKEIVFAAPPKKPGKAERVKFEVCYFQDADTPEAVRNRIVLDFGRDEGVAVLATFKKLQERPLGLVKYEPPKD